MSAALTPSAEQTIAKAAEMIRAGNDAAKVLHFVYGLAYMEGALAMASAGTNRVQAEVDRQKAAS